MSSKSLYHLQNLAENSMLTDEIRLPGKCPIRPAGTAVFVTSRSPGTLPPGWYLLAGINHCFYYGKLNKHQKVS